MTYQRKFQECPYKTSDGKCVHKHCDWRRKKKKRYCAYKEPKECEMYCEWVELISVADNSSMDELRYTDNEGDNGS